MFNRWLVKDFPATSTMAWSLLGMSLGSLDVTTEGLIEVFGMVGIGFSSEDVGIGEVCTGLEEELDEVVVGTNSEMLTDDLVPDGEGEEGCFGIMVCATVVVVVVLVVAEEGLGLVVVGLGVVVVVDVMAGVIGMVAVMAGVVGMVAVITDFGTASAVLDFSVEFVMLVVALVIELFCKVVGFVIVEVVEMETLASEADCSVVFDEPSGEDWEELVPERSWRSIDSLVELLSTSSDSAKTKIELVNG